MILKHINCVHCAETPFLPLTRAHELLDQHSQADDVVILLDHLWEKSLAIDMLQPLVAVLKEKRPWKIFAVVNSWERPNDSAIRAIGVDDILYVDFFLYRVFKEIVINKKCSTREITDAYIPYDKNKFLFLTGKAARHNRIGLLKKFVDAKLMKYAEWSFYYFEQNKTYNQQVRSYLPNVSDAEFNKFVKRWIRNPDNIDISPTVNKYGYEYNGIPYNINLYTQTDFSVVSETTFDSIDNPWITEKTWIPMLNKHPFIIAGDTNILNKLERMGFETFKEYLTVDYDQIADTDQRLTAVVDNTRHFVKTLNKKHSLVNQDANWNHTRIEQLYYQNHEAILTFIYKHKLTEFSIEDIVPTTGRLDERINKQERIKTFISFYNNIRDPAWPDITSVADFYNLPEHIQRECIDNFGLILPT